MKATTIPVFLAVLLWGIPGYGFMLSGLVSEADEPVDNAEILLINAKNRVVLKSDYTDPNGAFRFSVKPGVYNVATYKADYATVKKKGVIVRDKDVVIRIELVPKAFVEDAEPNPEEDCD